MEGYLKILGSSTTKINYKIKMYRSVNDLLRRSIELTESQTKLLLQYYCSDCLLNEQSSAIILSGVNLLLPKIKDNEVYSSSLTQLLEYLLNLFCIASSREQVKPLRDVALKTLLDFPAHFFSKIRENDHIHLISVIDNCLDYCFSETMDHKVQILTLVSKVFKEISHAGMKKILKFSINTWFVSLVPKMFDEPELREVCLRIVEASLPALTEVNYAGNARWKDVYLSICNPKGYSAVITKTMFTGDSIWHRQWICLIKLLGTMLHTSGGPINILLSVVEHGFKQDNKIRKEAFVCWKALIENFALSPIEMRSEKRLMLLSIPLDMCNAKQEDVALVKFDVWWYLIQKLQENNVTSHKAIFFPFLKFSFGEQNPKNQKGNVIYPGLCFVGVQKLIVQAFVEIMGHVDCQGCVEEGFQKLDSPLFDAKMLNLNPTVWFYSIKQCLLTISKLMEDANDAEKERLKINVRCIWGSFIKLCKDEDDSKSYEMFNNILQVLELCTPHCDNDTFADIVTNMILPQAIKANHYSAKFLNKTFDDGGIPLQKLLNQIFLLPPQNEESNINNASLKILIDTGLEDGLVNFCSWILPRLSHNNPHGPEVWCCLADSIAKNDYEFSIDVCRTILLWPLNNYVEIQKAETIFKSWKRLFEYLRVKSNPQEGNSTDASLAEFFYNFVWESGNLQNELQLLFILPFTMKKRLEVNPAAQMKFIKPGLEKIQINLAKVNVSEWSVPVFSGLCCLADAIGMILVGNSKTRGTSLSNPLLIDVSNLVMEYTNAVIVKYTEKLSTLELELRFNKLLESLSSYILPQFFSSLSHNCLQIILNLMVLNRKTSIIQDRCTRLLKEFQGNYKKVVKPNEADVKTVQELLKNPPTEPGNFDNFKKVPEKAPKSKAVPMGEDSQGFVIIAPKWKFDPKNLTEHQIEGMKRRREDIPALYEDLSQSQDEASIKAWKPPGYHSSGGEESKENSSLSKNLQINNSKETLVTKSTENVDFSVPEKGILVPAVEKDTPPKAGNNHKNDSPATPLTNSGKKKSMSFRINRNLKKLQENAAANGSPKLSIASVENTPQDKRRLSVEENVEKNLLSPTSERPSRIKKKPNKFYPDDDCYVSRVSAKKLKMPSSEDSSGSSSISNTPEENIENNASTGPKSFNTYMESFQEFVSPTNKAEKSNYYRISRKDSSDSLKENVAKSPEDKNTSKTKTSEVKDCPGIKSFDPKNVLEKMTSIDEDVMIINEAVEGKNDTRQKCDANDMTTNKTPKGKNTISNIPDVSDSVKNKTPIVKDTVIRTVDVKDSVKNKTLKENVASVKITEDNEMTNNKTPNVKDTVGRTIDLKDLTKNKSPKEKDTSVKITEVIEMKNNKTPKGKDAGTKTTDVNDMVKNKTPKSKDASVKITEINDLSKNKTPKCKDALVKMAEINDSANNETPKIKVVDAIPTEVIGLDKSQTSKDRDVVVQTIEANNLTKIKTPKAKKNVLVVSSTIEDTIVGKEASKIKSPKKRSDKMNDTEGVTSKLDTAVMDNLSNPAVAIVNLCESQVIEEMHTPVKSKTEDKNNYKKKSPRTRLRTQLRIDTVEGHPSQVLETAEDASKSRKRRRASIGNAANAGVPKAKKLKTLKRKSNLEQKNDSIYVANSLEVAQDDTVIISMDVDPVPSIEEAVKPANAENASGSNNVSITEINSMDSNNFKSLTDSPGSQDVIESSQESVNSCVSNRSTKRLSNTSRLSEQRSRTSQQIADANTEIMNTSHSQKVIELSDDEESEVMSPRSMSILSSPFRKDIDVRNTELLNSTLDLSPIKSCSPVVATSPELFTSEKDNSKETIPETIPSEASTSHVSPKKSSPLKISPQKMSPLKASPLKLSPAKILCLKGTINKSPTKSLPSIYKKISPIKSPTVLSPSKTITKQPSPKSSPVQISPSKLIIEQKSPPKMSPEKISSKDNSPVNIEKTSDKVSPKGTPEKISVPSEEVSPWSVPMPVISSPKSSKTAQRKSQAAMRGLTNGRAAQMLGMIEGLGGVKESGFVCSPTRKNSAVDGNGKADAANSKEMNLFSFSKQLPSPYASPCCPILKKSHVDVPTPGSPSNKKKRVSFHDPPVSTTVSVKNYIESPQVTKSPQKATVRNYRDELSFMRSPLVPKCLLKRMDSESKDDPPVTTDESNKISDGKEKLIADSQLSEPFSLDVEPLQMMDITEHHLLDDTAPIFPNLCHCPDSISVLASDLSSSLSKDLFLKDLTSSVTSVGDLAKMTELQINRLPIKTPKIATVRKTLLQYEKKWKTESLMIVVNDELKKCVNTDEDDAESDDVEEVKIFEEIPTKTVEVQTDEVLSNDCGNIIDDEMDNVDCSNINTDISDQPIPTCEVIEIVESPCKRKHIESLGEVSMECDDVSSVQITESEIVPTQQSTLETIIEQSKTNSDIKNQLIKSLPDFIKHLSRREKIVLLNKISSQLLEEELI